MPLSTAEIEALGRWHPIVVSLAVIGHQHAWVYKGLLDHLSEVPDCIGEPCGG